MSQRKTHPTLIGAFVLGAVALLIAGIMVVARGEMFHNSVPFVACFDSSVSGLRIGALVTYRGVTVGEVTGITVQLDIKSQTPIIPVRFELDPGRFQHMGDVQNMDPKQVYKRINVLIEKGLRAQLKLDSYLTGQLSIELDFIPDNRPVYRKPFNHPHDNTAAEFPTAPGEFDELMGQLKKLPIAELFTKLDKIATGLDKLVNSEESESILKNIDKATAELAPTIVALRKEIKPLTESLGKTIKTLNASFVTAGQAFTKLDALVTKLDDNADPMIKSYQDTMAQAKDALTQAEATIKTMDKAIANADKTLFAEDSKLHAELMANLKELKKTIRNVNVFAEYIQRHPEALLKGKKGQ